MANILIVDDDEIVAEMASDVLMGEGYACGWVNDGTKALDLLKWRKPDLVLLDQDMPGVSGHFVLRKLRESVELCSLPVIMFTAMSGATDEQQALYAGAQDYIRKPFDAKFLKWKVRQVLKAQAENPRKRDFRDAMAEANGAKPDTTAFDQPRYC